MKNSTAMVCLAVAIGLGSVLVSSSIRQNMHRDYTDLIRRTDELNRINQQIIMALKSYDPAFTSTRFLKQATGLESWIDNAFVGNFGDFLGTMKIEEQAFLLPSDEKQPITAHP
jgi:hypothetical protein